MLFTYLVFICIKCLNTEQHALSSKCAYFVFKSFHFCSWKAEYFQSAFFEADNKKYSAAFIVSRNPPTYLTEPVPEIVPGH